MTAELLVEWSAGGLRTALVCDGDITEIRTTQSVQDKVGAICLARISRVAADKSGAFLILDGDDEGFLPQKHFPRKAKDGGQAVSAQLAEGQLFHVQRQTAPTEAGKAWTVSPNWVLRGRYVSLPKSHEGLVFDAVFDGDMSAQKRLKEALLPVTVQTGLHVHAPAAEVDDDPVVAEAARLLGQRRALMVSASGKPRQLLAGESLLEHSLRTAPEQLDSIRVSGTALRACIAPLVERWPDLADKITEWREQSPLFEAKGVDELLDEILAGQLSLPSGGRITIDETQAATVIDVDAGKAVGGKSARKMHMKTNLEAADRVCRLLRLADIGGLVLVDFIDMRDRSDRDALLAQMDAALKMDPVPVNRTGLNRHGIVSLTRKKTGPSLRQTMLAFPPPRPKLETIARQFIQQAERNAAHGAKVGKLILRVSPALADWLSTSTLCDILRENTGLAVDLHVDEDRRDDDPAVHMEAH